MMDFANVKSVIIPEGEVAVIARGDEILWQKQTLPYKTELAYLESTGTQYIDTGIFPTDDFGYEIELEQISYGGEQCPIGCMVSGNRFVGSYFGNRTTATTTTISKAWGTLVNTHSVSPWGINQRILSSCNYLNSRKMVFNGVEVADLTEYEIKGTISNSIHLFNRNYSSGAIFKGRLYSAKITENDVVVHDFIPVLDSNGIPCMYDKVAEQFFYNQGTGTFLYGEKPTLPYKTELAYLEGTGTQYLDTGKFAPDNTDIEVTFQVDGKTNGAIFGGRNAQTSQTCTLFYLATSKPHSFRFDRVGQITVATANNISINTESVYQFSYKNKTAKMTNLTTEEAYSLYVGTPSTFTTNPINLFAVSGGTMLRGKIYSWKYWEDGILLQDFIPVLDWDDVPCMYDKVSNEFFYNKGTGEFAYA